MHRSISSSRSALILALSLVLSAPGLAAARALSEPAIDDAVLSRLTPEQAAAFAEGADPASLTLDDGSTLADLIGELLGGGTDSLVFMPVDSCSLLRTTHSVAGKMAANEIRPFLARGETTDLSGQGGAAGGCGIPTAAVAVMVSVTVEDPEGAGRLKGWPVDELQPQGDLLVYQTTVDLLDFFSLAVIGLCDLGAGPCTSGDFNLRNTVAAVHVRAEVAGYLLPVESCPAGSSIAEIGANGAVTCEPDDDTLASLACAVDEIAKWNGAAWACAPDDIGSVTDIWVDEAGDTMTGQLVINTGGGTALELHGDVDLIGQDVRKGGELLLHNPVNSTGVGLRALDNAQGTGNTAVGQDSLAANSGDRNTAVGTDSMRANTLGALNTAVGFRSMYSNGSGYRNTAVGMYSLRSNTNGQGNTAIGYDSLSTNTSGGYNTAVGFRALGAAETAGDNTALGNLALSNTTTGGFNTALGSNALHDNTTGNGNVAVGFDALFSNTTGRRNIAMSEQALRSNTIGNYNIALGFNTLYNNDYGTQNIALGAFTMQSNQNSHGNVAIGHGTFQAHSSGDDNIAIGRNAISNHVSGSANVVVGHQAGSNLTSGSTNILLGLNAGYNLTNGYDNIMIGNTGLPSDGGTIRIGTYPTQGGGTFIAGIYGTPIAGSPVVVDANGQLGVGAGGGDADTLDGLDSSQFLRSDTDDSSTGTLTLPAVDFGASLTDEDVMIRKTPATLRQIDVTSGPTPGTGVIVNLQADQGGLRPINDDTGDLGDATHRWSRIRGVSIEGDSLAIGTDSPQKDLHVTAGAGVVFHTPTVGAPSTQPFLSVETDVYSTVAGIASVVDHRQQTVASRTPTLYLENTNGATDPTNPLIEAKAAGATRLLVRHDGRVGIGTASPEVTLEVSSVIRATPTDAPGPCSASTEGSMYYDSSETEPCFCNGSDWMQFDGGGVCT